MKDVVEGFERAFLGSLGLETFSLRKAAKGETVPYRPRKLDVTSANGTPSRTTRGRTSVTSAA